MSFGITCLDDVLYYPVFERVIGDDRESSALAEPLRSRLEHLAKRIHLMVDFYAERLEELRHVLLLTLALEEWIHHFEEIARRLYQSLLSIFHY
mgnify:CR=1 FL=1